MNYGKEPWRKLYVRESTEDRLFAVLLRGLRDYLIRHAKDDGTLLAKTSTPGTDMAKALGAHPEETSIVAAHVDSLVADGYLSHRKGRLWITNFIEAQAARSPGAMRQEKWRSGNGKKTKASKNETQLEHNELVSYETDRDVTGASRETSQKKRIEEKRLPPTPVGGDGGGGSGAEIPCPVPIPIAAEVVTGLELDVGIPAAVAEANLVAWARQQQADPNDRRLVGAWAKCAVAAVRGKWSNRDKRAEMRAIADRTAEPASAPEERVRTYLDVQAEQRARDAAARAKRGASA